MSLPPPQIPLTNRALIPLEDRDMVELRFAVSYALSTGKMAWPKVKPDRHRLELDDWDELSNHILRHLLLCGYRAVRTEPGRQHTSSDFG